MYRSYKYVYFLFVLFEFIVDRVIRDPYPFSVGALIEVFFEMVNEFHKRS